MPKSKAFERLNFILEHSPAILPLVMIPFGLLARQGLLDDRYYYNDTVFMTIVTVFSIASFIYIWRSVKGQESKFVDAAFLILFNVLSLLFVLFVSGFLSAFLAVWILLLVSADIRFSQKGSILSFLALVASGGLLIYLNPSTPVSEQLEIVQGVLIVGAIGYVIARIRSATISEKTALVKSRKEEIYQRERLLALVNSMGDAVMAVDQNGNIGVYNSTLLNLLDTNVDLNGHKIDEVLKLYDADNHEVNIFAEAMQKQTVFSRSDLTYKFNDNDQIKLYINVAPILPSYQSADEKGFIFILRDITKEKTLEEQRDEFISVVSHELRTPVTIAEGNMSNIQLLIERGTDPKVISDAAKDAHEQIVYLAKLVNDLATLAKAERGTGGELEQTDINLMLKGFYDEYSPQADAKKLKFILDSQVQLPQLVTNKLYLREILQNLITNALKYTPKGSVTLNARTDDKNLYISVIDTGIGISNTDKRRVFEKFYRSEDYRTRESSGTGLGLYVCKSLAEKLGYEITFESELNKGSRFSVVIPLSKARSAAPEK
ncbi:MAG TPA: ATP-binding protein [Candidatus Saccharimonadales bacterium]|nr:ATP-binding protein [Candidatus Saccharimonadales bacterium]